jgi:2-phospho-L-lactate/phosphoenolpyruvate guanylyltransferase
MNRQPATFPVIIPVKPFHLAKQRLAEMFGPAERAALARSMFIDVLRVVTAVVPPSDVIVVTSSLEASDIAAAAGAQVLLETASSDLNAAIEAASNHAVVQAAGGFVVVPSDVPEITAAAIQQAFRALDRDGLVVIAPALSDGGTNLLGCRPPDAIRPGFGVDSLAGHVAAAERAGLVCRVLSNPELGRDIDRPADIARFLAQRSATATDRLLRALRIDPRYAAFGFAPADRTAMVSVETT